MELLPFIDAAIEEDIRDGDHTSLACIPAGETAKAYLLVKEPGILAGIDVAETVFNRFDPELMMDIHFKDGAEVNADDIAFHVSGAAHSILKAERLILNIMQRMSGIATTTRHYVDAVAGTGVIILDTRKTTPLLRRLEKMAVRIGGAQNHRFGLYDMIMIKDNHITSSGGIEQAITAVKKYQHDNDLNLQVEIEAASLEQVKQIMELGGVDRIMLDNFTPEGAAEAVKLIDGKFETEISGGINLDTVVEYAKAKPDFISVGALTHSVKSLDLSLKTM